MHIRSLRYSSIRQLNTEPELPPDGIGTDDHIGVMAHVELSEINVFAGSNGAGKSTVIDMVRALVNPCLLPSLATEFPESKAFSGFSVEFDQIAYSYVFSYVSGDPSFQYVWCQMLSRRCGKQISDPIRKDKRARHSTSDTGMTIKPAPNVEVRYLHCGGEQRGIDADAILVLNELGPNLTGAIDWNTYSGKVPAPVNNVPIEKVDSKTVRVWLASHNANERPLAPNKLPVDWLPAGWKAYAAILNWLNDVPKGAIALLEEPEAHMHPHLQRSLFSSILSCVEAKSIQLLMTTHSSTLLNAAAAAATRKASVKLFQLLDGKVEPADIGQALDGLGYRASDLMQANCVIWVEGPSDRMYLNWWISAKEPGFIEGIHYSIMFYGGSLFHHVSGNADPVGDLISLKRLNRYSAIMFDSDKSGPSVKLSDNKLRLEQEFSKTDNSGFAWVTAGREIENYLVESNFKTSLKKKHQVHQLIGHGIWANWLKFKVAAPRANAKNTDLTRMGDKVLLAREYINTWKVDFSILDLEMQVTRLCTFIKTANQ